MDLGSAARSTGADWIGQPLHEDLERKARPVVPADDPFCEPPSGFEHARPGTVLRTPVAPARTLTPEDRAAGVVSDRSERLGGKANGPVVRVVEIHAAGKSFILITSREDLPAEIIGLIYRYRWQIELFFKWFKMILGNRHWLAESPRGVAIQLYSALIATLLLMLLTGKRPTKRQMEAIHLYFVGFATKVELLRELGLQKS